MKQPLYKHLASTLQAHSNCAKSNNAEWLDKHYERIESLVENHMPSGSGIDGGIDLSMTESKPDRLVFFFDFHHMTNGMHSGWTSHKLIVIPSLVNDIDLKITGENRDDIKEYFYQIFNDALLTDVE